MQKFTKKALWFILFMLVFSFGWNTLINFFEPAVSTDIALGQAAYDSSASHMAMRSYGSIQNLAYSIPAIVFLIGAMAVFWSDFWSAVARLNKNS